MLQKSVALDLRDYLDVDEALRTLIFGKPKEIAQSKVSLYLAYAQKKNNKQARSLANEDAKQDDLEKD